MATLWRQCYNTVTAGKPEPATIFPKSMGGHLYHLLQANVAIVTLQCRKFFQFDNSAGLPPLNSVQHFSETVTANKSATSGSSAGFDARGPTATPMTGASEHSSQPVRKQPKEPGLLRASPGQKKKSTEHESPQGYLTRSLGRRWLTYRKQTRACRRQPSETAVHELRVATRRLISEFRLLGELLRKSEDVKPACKVLKAQLKPLGKLRDVHVKRLWMDRRKARFPELMLLVKDLQKAETELTNAAAKAVKRFKAGEPARCVALLTRTLSEVACKRGASRRLCVRAHATARNAQAEVIRRRRAVTRGDLRTIHRTRIAFKRYRYMVEALSPWLTGLTRQELQKLASYQRRMGNIQDLDVLDRYLETDSERNEAKRILLCPLHRLLKKRKSKLLHDFFRSADQILNFWPHKRPRVHHGAEEKLSHPAILVAGNSR